CLRAARADLPSTSRQPASLRTAGLQRRARGCAHRPQTWGQAGGLSRSGAPATDRTLGAARLAMDSRGDARHRWPAHLYAGCRRRPTRAPPATDRGAAGASLLQRRRRHDRAISLTLLPRQDEGRSYRTLFHSVLIIALEGLLNLPKQTTQPFTHRDLIAPGIIGTAILPQQQVA